MTELEIVKKILEGKKGSVITSSLIDQIIEEFDNKTESDNGA